MIAWLLERARRAREWAPSAALGVSAWLGMALAAFLLVLLLWAFLGSARAQAGEWLTGASAYLIVERPWADPGVCRYGPQDMTSNLGAELTVWEGGFRHARVEWQARVTHHSCAFGRDWREYDAAGLGLVFRFRR